MPVALYVFAYLLFCAELCPYLHKNLSLMALKGWTLKS